MMTPAGFVRAKAREWARRRQGSDRDPLVLQRRRIYILPTRQGLAFAGMLFAMLVGSMNYNNSLGLALTFFLAGLAIVAMHHCHRNLLDLVVRNGGAEPVFAGQNAPFHIVLSSRSSRERQSIQLGLHDYHTDAIDLLPESSGSLTLEVPTTRRGLVHLDRFSVSTTYPFGLFRAWTWVHMDLSTVVYPRPADDDRTPPPERTDTGGAQDDQQGDEDFAGLRNYRPGDSPRHIAWKAYAGGRELVVKQYAGTDVTTHWFDWESLPDLDLERRLEQISRWIVDAEDVGHAYGIRLPARQIEPNLGKSHERSCLTSLAMFEA